MNAFAVQALAAAAGPDFLRNVRAGGKPATPSEERRVLVRPERMHPIADKYVQYWIDRLGIEARERVLASSEAELAALAEVSLRAGR